MSSQKYNIKWHTYSDHLEDMLQGMMKSGLFTDVTLVCDDNKIFKAHKIVLSACSAVFERILNGIPQSSSTYNLFERNSSSRNEINVRLYVLRSIYTF